MESISAEEFLKQPKEVQEVFMEWWKPSIGDLFLIERTTSFNGDKHSFIECFLTGFEITDLIERERKRIICPLLTEGQLRKFIEDKINSKIEIVYVSKEGIEGEKSYYRIERYSFLDGDFNNNAWIAETDNLIEAYWKVALGIAKEEIK